MSAYYRVGSELTVPHIPSSDVAAGEMIAVGDHVRIAHHDIKAGQTGSLAVGGGNVVYEITKETGVGAAIGDGDNAYLNEASQEATNNAAAGANKLIGVCVAAAGDDDTSVMVRHD